MDDTRRLRALQAVGIDMAHHVVAHLALAGLGLGVVDVVAMGLQLGDLLVRDGKAERLLRAGQGDHSRRQVRNLKSCEKRYCISALA